MPVDNCLICVKTHYDQPKSDRELKGRANLPLFFKFRPNRTHIPHYLPWFRDWICQITVILTEGKRIKSTVDLLLNPERELSLAAFYINRLDESKLSVSPLFSEITYTREKGGIFTKIIL